MSLVSLDVSMAKVNSDSNDAPPPSSVGAGVGTVGGAGGAGAGAGAHGAAGTPAADVLVIGGTGLMGAPTARLLQKRGHHVVVLSRGAASGGGTNGRRPEQAAGCTHLVCDRDGGGGGGGDDDEKDLFVQMLAAKSTPRIVIDFTAMHKQHIEQVIEAHKQTPLQHYIFISTNMVYPGGPENMDVSPLCASAGAGWIAEDAANLDSEAALLDTYGGNKLRCEQLLRDAGAGPSPLPSTVVRPPSVVGPGYGRENFGC